MSKQCEDVLREQALVLQELAERVEKLDVSPEGVAYELWPVIKALVDEGEMCRQVVDDIEDEEKSDNAGAS